MLDPKKFQEEKKNHITHLNTVVGGFAFTITLTCLTFKNAETALLVCMPFIAGLAINGFQSFPASLQLLRKKAKLNFDAKQLVEHIEKTEYGIISFVCRCIPYIFGFGFYLFATLFPKYFQNLFGINL